MRHPKVLLSCLVGLSLAAASCGSGTDTAVSATDTATATSEAAGETTSTESPTTAPAQTEAPAEAAQGLTPVSFASSVLGEAQLNQAAAQSGSFEVTTEVNATDGSATFTMSGRFNQAAKASEVTIDLAELAALMSEAEDSPLPAEMDGLFDEPILVRTIGDSAYVSGGVFTMFTGGEGWLELDADDASSITSDLGADLTAQNPLDEFTEDDVIIEDLGSDSIDGVNTTHYQVTVVGKDLQPFDVWIDDDQLLRQVITVQTGGDSTLGQAGTVKLTARFFDYNEPVEIETPPADQIVDGSSIAALLGADS